MYQTKSFKEKLVRVVVSTFLSFMFVEQLIYPSIVFSAVLSNSCQKTTMADLRYKSIKSWKIDNIGLTQQFSLSISTDFRYQSIKITGLLPIFIDTDFYRLTTPGFVYLFIT